MAYFIDVILPIPVEKAFTYEVNIDEARFLKPGMRVAVPFGKSKIYAAIVRNIHQEHPVIYEPKPIDHILDETPVITTIQLQLWQWMSQYYMCTEGEIMRAALPRTFLLESETMIYKNEEVTLSDLDLTDQEFLIVEALQYQSQLKIGEVSAILEKQRVLPIIERLLQKGALSIQEEIYERYIPKIAKYVKLHSDYEEEAQMHELLDTLSRAPRQREIVLQYFSLKAKNNTPIKTTQLQKQAKATSTQLKTLVDKGIFEIYQQQENRVTFGDVQSQQKELNKYQQQALVEITESFTKQAVCLLHGVTSSGKTEIYVNLIESYLKLDKQVLYLLPEIALTTQLIKRLEAYFGDTIVVFHSKYSIHERTEVWYNVLNKSAKAQVIIGARSAILLPFQDLGLLIVDEEHETSYKQFDPAPRYHARDTAIMLGHMHKAKVLLGSATPAIETYHNAQSGKYGLVTLSHRYGNVLLPEIELVDIKEKHRRKLMTGYFSDTLLRAITDALEEKEQVILFQNRRGYSPILECLTCGHSPQCPNCDVSLTYHKYRDQLRCHYCGHHIAMQQKCQACGSAELSTKGFGTEQVETALKELYPEASISRMDSDTTRGKYAFEKLITAFEEHDIDILVGTQMLTKGLDFRNVTLVGVLHADSMLHHPDFRAHERSYQLIAQVSGRAGRTQKRGKVLVQTYNPYHQILQQVSVNKYNAMLEEQLEERRNYRYPPFYRLIKIIIKHRDYQKIEDAASWLAQSFKNTLQGVEVLGPEVPSIARIRNMYHKHIMIKLSRKQSSTAIKKDMLRVQTSFKAIAQFRSVRVIMDVDSYT